MQYSPVLHRRMCIALEQHYSNGCLLYVCSNEYRINLLLHLFLFSAVIMIFMKVAM